MIMTEVTARHWMQR